MSTIISLAQTDQSTPGLSRRKALTAGGSLAASLAAPSALVSLGAFAPQVSAQIAVDSGTDILLNHPTSTGKRQQWIRKWSDIRHTDGTVRRDIKIECVNQYLNSQGKWVTLKTVGAAKKKFVNGVWKLDIFNPPDNGGIAVKTWNWSDMTEGGPGCRRLSTEGSGSGTTWMAKMFPANAKSKISKMVVAPGNGPASFAYITYLINGVAHYMFFRRDPNQNGDFGWDVSVALKYVDNKSTIDNVLDAIAKYEEERTTLTTSGFAAIVISAGAATMATVVDAFFDDSWSDGAWITAICAALTAVTTASTTAYNAWRRMGLSHDLVRRRLGAISAWANFNMDSTCDNV